MFLQFDDYDLDTPFGLWRLASDSTKGTGTHDSDKLVFDLRFNRIDSHTDEEAPNVRRLTLCVYGENMAHVDFHPKLWNAIAIQFDPVDQRCLFNYKDGMLRVMHEDEAF